LASPQEIVAYSGVPLDHRPALGRLDEPAYRWLNCNTYSGSTVAYGYGLYFIAPLWGDDLHNQVVYAGNSEETLSATIAKDGPEFVFVERHPENAWMDYVPSLAQVYRDEQFSIFWVKPVVP
jgi:methenyltetrahydromethanopterin cyclohydrolase